MEAQAQAFVEHVLSKDGGRLLKRSSVVLANACGQITVAENQVLATLLLDRTGNKVPRLDTLKLFVREVDRLLMWRLSCKSGAEHKEWVGAQAKRLKRLCTQGRRREERRNKSRVPASACPARLKCPRRGSNKSMSLHAWKQSIRARLGALVKLRATPPARKVPRVTLDKLPRKASKPAVAAAGGPSGSAAGPSSGSAAGMGSAAGPSSGSAPASIDKVD